MVQYLRPGTLNEALEALHSAGDNGRVLVGGTDLLVDVRRRPLEPLVLIDIKSATDLPAALEFSDDVVRIGPTTTMSDLVADPRIASWFPALVASAKVVGSIAIRNRASLVGNICNASPACDTAPALLIYGARVAIRSGVGERQVPITQFFTGPGQTQCADAELVTAIEIPRPPTGYRSAFQRLTRRRGVDLATVNVAAGVTDADVVSLGMGAVAPTPIYAEAAASIDLSDDNAVTGLVEQLTEVAMPISDVRATEAYRRAMIAVLATRAIKAATRTSQESAR